MSIYCYKCVESGYLSLCHPEYRIYRYVCGLNGSLYSNVSPQSRFIVISVAEMALILGCRLNVELLL